MQTVELPPVAYWAHAVGGLPGVLLIILATTVIAFDAVPEFMGNTWFMIMFTLAIVGGFIFHRKRLRHLTPKRLLPPTDKTS